MSARMIALAVSLIAPMAFADQLTLLDGTVIGKAPVKAIDEDGAITFGSKKINFQKLRRIHNQGVKADALPLRVTRLFLTDGSVIVAKKLKIDGETVTFSLAEAEAASLPLTSLRGVVFMPMSADESGRLIPDPAFADVLADATDRQDTLFVINDDSIMTVRGVLESVGAEDVEFNWNDKSRTIALNKLYGITAAAPAVPPKVVGQARVHLKGGSTLWATPTLRNDRLTLTRNDGLTLTVPWNRVMRMDVNSRRMAFLSDLKPTSMTNRPIASTPHPPVMDGSVSTGVLRIGDREFERGIGIHAPTEMTWQIDGAYDQLAMVIGIDEAVGNRGDCVVRIMGDGRQLLNKRLTGSDEPMTVNLEVTGVEQLTIIAEAGNGLDLGDHVNLADARLIKNE